MLTVAAVAPLALSFIVLSSDSNLSTRLAARYNKIVAKLKSLGVLDEVKELASDLKLQAAIRFGKGGEERALNILERHLKGQPPEKVERLKKAFDVVKADIQASQKLT